MKPVHILLRIPKKCCKKILKGRKKKFLKCEEVEINVYHIDDIRIGKQMSTVVILAHKVAREKKGM